MDIYREVLQEGMSVSLRAELQGPMEDGDEFATLLSLTGWSLTVPASSLQVPGDGLHFSLCGFRVVRLDGLSAVLSPLPDSFVLGHRGVPRFHCVVDLCCGLGGMSTGAQFAGLTVLGGLDKSSWAVEVYNLNHDAPAILGDLSHLSSVRALAQMVDYQSAGVLMGFPCPPFSTRGDQNGFSDPRAWTFVHGLNAAYLLRASFVLLECTPMVESFPELVQHLHAFARTMGFGWTSQILHLDEAWPCRRTRWWCLLVPDHVHCHLSLEDLPRAAALQQVNQAISKWPTWTVEEEMDLFWNPQEVDFYERYAVLEDLLLDMDGKCPTLLHSLGHLDRKCPCGCRTCGLSHTRLARDGISALAVKSTSVDGLRHLHPLEAGFFCTLPANFVFPQVRASLPLVGQSAAPLQAHWMLSQLLRAVQLSVNKSPEQLTEVSTCHHRLQTHLLHLAFHLWPTEDTKVPREVAFRFVSGCTLVVTVPAQQRLDEWISTQLELGGWGSGFSVSLNGLDLPPGAILKSFAYDVQEPLPLSDRPYLAILCGGQVWIVYFGTGVTLGALLTSVGFSGRGLQFTVHGHVIPMSCPLSESLVGTLARPGYSGAGPGHAGINNLQLDAEAVGLLAHAPPGFQYLSASALTSLMQLPLNQMKEALAMLVLPTTEHVFGIFCHNQHWACVSFVRQEARFVYHDGLADMPSVGNVEWNKAHRLLVDELPKHGVPADVAANRAVQALKKLTAAAVLRAFDAKNPWQALKSLGNSSERPFQWVLHAELEKHVDARAMNKKAPMAKGRKAPAHKPRSVALVPSQIRVSDKAFVDENDQDVASLALDQISPTARGLVIVTTEDAIRFLRDGKKISVDCLALLTLSVIDIPPECPLKFTHLTWPGLLVDTLEPVLVRGTCIQLGDLIAAPVVGTSVPTQVETDLIRLFVYRDQWPQEWAVLTRGPLRALVAHFACLQFCPESCSDGCKKFHPAVEEAGISMVVLDAFAWKWLDAQGRTTQQQKAQSFSLLIRIPKSGTKALMAISGTDGLYTELRDDQQKVSSSVYAVVWLSDDLEAAKHRLRSLDKALHLVRFHAKYGLRCLKKDEKALYGELFPSRTCVDCGTALHFEMGPWPYGATKQTVVEFLASLPWSAKPLKPVRGGKDGRYWLIGSSDDPPTAVVPYSEQFLTITKVKDMANVKPAPNVVASLKTLQRLTSSSPATHTDPWLTEDPWKSKPLAPKQVPAAAASSSAAASTKLQEMEERLASQFSEQLRAQVQTVHDENMTDSTSRLDQLEVSMQEMRGQQEKFTQWCHDAAKNITEIREHAAQQDGKLNFIDQQLSGQIAATEKLNTQVGGLQKNIQTEMKEQFRLQTEAIDAMLSKHRRTEFGEAAHPGPNPLVLGTANPSGISGKTLSFLDLDRGIWNIAETQATDVGFRRFDRELRAFQQPGRSIQARHGAFAPPRARSQFAGTWTGVAQMADVPMRSVHLPWRGCEFDSGRLVVSSFHLGSHCLTGAAVYGPPKGPTYGDPRKLTSELLTTLTEELIIGRSGPRFVAGDFNVSTDDLEAFRHCRALGWQDVQTLAAQRFQRPWTPTCKGSTAPDHIWVSPELQGWITNVTASDEIFADHSILQAHLDEPFTWDYTDTTKAFAKWSGLAEDELVESLTSHTQVPSSCRGRGSTVKIVKRPCSVVPITPGRHGDVQPRTSFAGRLVHQWFLQLRRIQAFSRRAGSLSSSPALAADQCMTWKAVHSAKGFQDGFAAWWAVRPIKLPGAPEVLPCYPPSAALATAIFMDFEANFRSLEQWHVRQRTKIIKARHHDHNRLLFQQMKSQKAGSVSHFRHGHKRMVSFISPDAIVELDSPLPVLDSATWTLDGTPVKVTPLPTPDCCVIEGVDLDFLEVGQTLTATVYVTDFQALESDLASLWNPIWQRHGEVAIAHWDRIVNFGRVYLPSVPGPAPSWSSQKLRDVLSKYKKKATRGPDSWGRFDPSFAQTWTVLHTLWRLSHTFDFIREAWSALSISSAAPVGVLHAVSSALDFLGWSLGESWVLWGSWFTVSWFSLSVEALRRMVEHDWQQVMCSRLPTRHDLTGLTSIDAAVSFRSFSTKQRDIQELVGTIQDGTFCTNNVFAKFDPTKPAVCTLCNEPDTLEHRCLRCPRFLEIQRKHEMVVRRWTSHPRHFTEHGLVTKNPFLEKHMAALLELPDTKEQFHWVPEPNGEYNVFTDGSCRHPRCPTRRLAAWAVIVMEVPTVLSAGLLPAFQLCDTSFWQNYESLCQHHLTATQAVGEQLQFLVDIAQHELSNRGRTTFDPEDLPLSSLVVEREPNSHDICLQISPEDIETLDVQLLNGFSVQFGKSLVQFLIHLDFEAQSARFVTGLEMMFAFVSFSGTSIPWPRSASGVTIYEDPFQIQAGGLMRHTISSALNVFKAAVQSVFTAIGVQFDCSATNRPDLFLMVPQWSIKIGWPDEVEADVSGQIRSIFRDRPHRRACDLARPLP
eukprot:Skav211708  [mRNA]  locus=scaffold2852:32753:42021:+ [translate_table: standard]